MKITLDHLLAQRHPVADLGSEVRQRLGKPLRRASPLTQLAVSGALACLPVASSAQPLALLWQSTYGPRAETLALLDEVCCGTAEPLPFDFLASQPAIAAAQLKPWLPGLLTAHHLPLDNEAQSQWTLMLALAHAWLSEGRFAQVLCAHLDIADGQAHVKALAASYAALAKSVRADIDTAAGAGDADTADLFTGMSRGLDKTLWFLESHLQAGA